MTAPTPDELAAAQQQAAMYSPQPIPVQVATATIDGGIGGVPFVLLTLRDATGVRQVFLDADTALQVAENLRVEAREAKRATHGGLHLPPGSLLNGQGGPL